MNIDMLNTFIKFIAINSCTVFSFFKLIHHKDTSSIYKKIFIIFINIALTAIQCIFQNAIPVFFRISFIILCYSIVLGEYTKTNLALSLLYTLLSYAISYIFNAISSVIIIFSFTYFTNLDYKNSIIHGTIAISTFVLIYYALRIRRLNHGLPFLKMNKDSEFLNIVILAISTVVIFMYFLIGDYTHAPLELLILILFFFSIIMLIMLQKSFVLFHKNKLIKATLKDYEQELSETKQKLSTALSEKQQLVKSNHEFYHRQEALNKKLDDLLNQATIATNTEFSQEYSDILDRINNLSNEYSSKTQSIPKLPISKIEEIDDMLSYMQSECIKNNIDFIVKIDYDIGNIIGKHISKSQLETLLGDLIRNAIIAINHSSNNFRNIMVVFGIKDNTYELCIYDSGIPFEIKTLLNLGLHPASTHEDEGGTGIGFVTTFETLEACKSSFVINELSNNNYTKFLEIKFDGKKEYIIISERSDEIHNLNKTKRNIIFK